MARRKKSIGSGAKWADELVDVLSEFVEEERATADRIFRETAYDTRDKLRATSPKQEGRGGGEYARGWEVKEIPSGITGRGTTYVVCNPKHYRLTHLLERGHQTFNQYGGPYKRARARKHIKPAEVYGNETLLQRLRAKL